MTTRAPETAVRAVDRAIPSRPWWVISGAVALTYFALGLVTLWLGQLSGLAAPVWPAAGLAFAAAALWRWRAWPGILVGSAAVNVLWLLRVGESASTSWATGVAIGLGAAVQAALAAALVARFVGPRLRFDSPGPILLTLLLAGPIACVINPTIGVAAQVANGVLGVGEAVATWLTWWAGDAMGVIVFAPIVLMLIPSQSAFWDGRRWKVALPSVLIVTALSAGTLLNVSMERDRVADEVQQLGIEAATDLESNVARHQEVLEGIRGLVNASDEVTSQEFATYTEGFLRRFPNMQALSWNPVVSREDVDAFEASQRSQPGLADFIVTERDSEGNLVPVANRPDYVVVAYIEPVEDNRDALGFDIQSNPTRASAIAEARDTGRGIGTAPIELVQESGNQKGMLALLPVYSGGRVPETESERRAQLVGFAVGVYRLEDLLVETFANSQWDNVDITLTDVTDRDDAVVIAELPARTPARVDQVSADPVIASLPVEAYGRTWDLTVQPTSGPLTEPQGGMTLVLVFSSLGLAFLLEAFLLLLSALEQQARREAETSRHEAAHDPLTGLSNRRDFVRQFRDELVRNRSESVTDVLLFCDLDGFKDVNDRSGHAAGDELLQAVAEQLRLHVRGNDVTARMGGDEFAVLLFDCSIEHGRRIAEAIADSIDRLNPPRGDDSTRVGVSIGLTGIDSGAREGDLDEYLRQADQACYEAKRGGGSQVRVYSPAQPLR